MAIKTSVLHGLPREKGRPAAFNSMVNLITCKEEDLIEQSYLEVRDISRILPLVPKKVEFWPAADKSSESSPNADDRTANFLPIKSGCTEPKVAFN